MSENLPTPPDSTAPLENSSPKNGYTATLSKIFTSFSGVATKEEYRKAFWTILAWAFLFACIEGLLILAVIITNDYEFSIWSSLPLIIYSSLFLSLTYFFAIWKYIKIRIKRFHSFGHSFIISYFVPGFFLQMPACGLILSFLPDADVLFGTGNPNFVYGIILGCFAYIFTIIWESVLYFGNAQCDGGKPSRMAVWVILGFIIIPIVALGLYYSTPKQVSTRILKAKGVIVEDVNLADEEGKTLLHRAAAGIGDTEMVELLINVGADVNLADKEGKTPLHWAASEGDTESVKLLIKAGSDVNRADNYYGKTPLHWAAENRLATKSVKLLIKAGADVNRADNYYGKTPLHWAAAHNWDTESVKLLIKAGADVNLADKLGETPLHEAASEGHPEVAKVLIAAGAVVNRANKEGKTPLFAAASREHHPEAAKVLIAAGADVNRANIYGATPLFAAAKNWRIEIAKVLIAAGAVVNRANKEGKTPLHWAAKNGRTGVVETLIAAGADVNLADKEGKTPLHEARETEIVKLLIKAGADVNLADKEGKTPLDVAVNNWHSGIVKLLEEAGAKR